MDNSHIYFALILLVSLLGNVWSLKCHQCSSADNSKCDDPMWYEAEKSGGERKIKTLEFYKDCPNDGQNYTLCRKIRQTVRDHTRVIRSCGWVAHKNPCYQTVLEEYNTLVCQCSEDGCNSASSMALSMLALLAVTLPAALL